MITFFIALSFVINISDYEREEIKKAIILYLATQESVGFFIQKHEVISEMDQAILRESQRSLYKDKKGDY